MLSGIVLTQAQILSLYRGASVEVEGTDTSDASSGVSWGNIVTVGVDKEPPTQCVPTLSEWAMIIMVTLLALGGVLVLRRRLLRHA
jgi:hypothetical protein